MPHKYLFSCPPLYLSNVPFERRTQYALSSLTHCRWLWSVLLMTDLTIVRKKVSMAPFGLYFIWAHCVIRYPPLCPLCAPFPCPPQHHCLWDLFQFLRHLSQPSFSTFFYLYISFPQVPPPIFSTLLLHMLCPLYSVTASQHLYIQNYLSCFFQPEALIWMICPKSTTWWRTSLSSS